jgi:transposase-like protein
MSRFWTYRLSYRDLAAMMAERGIIVTHTTIMRWVLRYLRARVRGALEALRSTGE